MHLNTRMLLLSSTVQYIAVPRLCFLVTLHPKFNILIGISLSFPVTDRKLTSDRYKTVLSHATVLCAHFHCQKAKQCLATMVTLFK